MIDNRNKLEKLEMRVKNLEDGLNKRPFKEEVVKETQARLSGYQDTVRSEKGSIFMKKNFEMKARKALEDPRGDIKLDPQVDNVITMHYNEREKGRLNHIFLGTASLAGKNFNSTLQGVAIKNNDAPIVPNNGNIQFILLREEYLKNSGVVDESKVLPQIDISPGELHGLPGGEVTSMFGTGRDGLSQLSYMESPTKPETYRFIRVDRNGIVFSGPLTLGGVTINSWNDISAGDELKRGTGTITKSDIPEGESFVEVEIDVSGSQIKPPAIVSNDSWNNSDNSKNVWAKSEGYSISGGYVDKLRFTTYNNSGGTATIGIGWQLLGKK